MRFKSWSPHAMRQDRMGYPVDGWTEGPGLPQSIWRYKWLVAALVLLGLLIGFLILFVAYLLISLTVTVWVLACESRTVNTMLW